MGQGTETCADRPTEVSVIRFVSRNRTIEEIAPKKEVYTCKQRGCGKIFTNQDEYKNHEALEALKIRFICREPGCGEELSDPGSMWRHYQEWHNNETNVFSCPYTSCRSVHPTSDSLEEHIETCHRQPPTLPTEPEIICFEGSESVIDEETGRNEDDNYYEADKDSHNRSPTDNDTGSRNNEFQGKKDNFSATSEDHSSHIATSKKSNGKSHQSDDFMHDRKKFTASPKSDDYIKSNDNRSIGKYRQSDDLHLTKESSGIKYEERASKSTNSNSILQTENSQESSNVVFINDEVTITKNLKNDGGSQSQQGQEHRIDLGNLESVFRSGFERDSPKIEDGGLDTNSNCSDDEEYTPKKQRMSRHKQEPYKCDVNGCGKMYKYISHYRHHQDSHKLVTTAINSNPAKQTKAKQGKASTVSFFLCKMPGCGAEVNNVTGLWKHYQDNHANSKPPQGHAAKGNEIFRCKVPGCDMEFGTTLMLYKHFNEIHMNGSTGNSSTNAKTGNGSSNQFADQMFQDDATAQQGNFKTDFEANNKTNANDYVESDDEDVSLTTVKKESRD
ncbi:uncharacterized protein LOC107267634 [Cephus cinctus]|uniref:Uncharacterized protein LOC107267634 n=1 Tax=Cephus cinctus TaxID=211228 RepID=A0AAJ7BV29_CEPCN|nr:uncharacterized protein LOC107267634 [Cephus cinctus]